MKILSKKKYNQLLQEVSDKDNKIYELTVENATLKEALEEYKDKVNLLVAEEAYESLEVSAKKAADEKPVGVFVGPEGGWTENELTLFKEAALDGLELGHLILRAETAAVAAVTKLII